MQIKKIYDEEGNVIAEIVGEIDAERVARAMLTLKQVKEEAPEE